MSYIFKCFLLLIGLTLLSSVKGWGLLMFIIYGIPVLLIWWIILAVAGRNNKIQRDQAFHLTSAMAIGAVFAMPGVGDSSDASAFTVLMTNDSSLIFHLSWIVSLVCCIAFFVFGIRGLWRITKAQVTSAQK